MIQRDYILRMIEEIGRFLVQLSGLKSKKQQNKGFHEFCSFIEAHYNIFEDELCMEQFDVLEAKLKTAFENYPDELGQLFANGGEMAREAGKGKAAEVLLLLSWNALSQAEKNSGSFRFERMVEMNDIKEKLALMGINVGQ